MDKHFQRASTTTKRHGQTIVIGHPNMQFDRVPEVFIPVGIPGITISASMARMDNVVSLAIKKSTTICFAEFKPSNRTSH